MPPTAGPVLGELAADAAAGFVATLSISMDALADGVRPGEAGHAGEMGAETVPMGAATASMPSGLAERTGGPCAAVGTALM